MSMLFKKILFSYQNLGFTGSIQQLLRFISYYIHRVLNLPFPMIPVKEHHLQVSSSDMGISRALFLYGDREQQFAYLLDKLVKPGMTVLDIGANLGFYVLKEAHLLKGSGKIFAAEPSPFNIELLKKNITSNGLDHIATALHLGFGEKTGTETMYLSKCTNLNSFVQNMSENEFQKRQLTNETIEMKMTCLDDFITQYGNVDLLRMDIEGYEVEVLRGARKAIAEGRFRGIITLETHLPQYNEQHSLRNELQFLFDNGYKILYLTSNKEPAESFRLFNLFPAKKFLTSPSCIQGVYEEISNDTGLQLITNFGGVRDVVLALNK